MSLTENAPDRAPVTVRGESREERALRLGVPEASLLVLMIASIAVARAFPFPAVKWGLVVVLGAVFVGHVTRYPALALALLASITPALDIIRIPSFGIPGLNTETVLVVLALVIWARHTQLHGRDHVGPPLGKIVGLYALLIVLSALTAWVVWNDPLIGVLASAKNHLSFFVFLPVVFHVCRTRREQALLVAAGSIAILLNSVQAVNHSMIAFLAGTLERHRAMAILALQPNTFGAALVMYLPAFILLALNRVHNALTQVWFVAVAGITGFALLLTLSRGAWLGLVAGLCVVALLGDRRLLLLLGLAAATYAVWVPEAVIQRVEETTQFNEDATEVDDQMVEGSAQMRIEQYRSLRPMMAPRPVLGWGYETYARVFGRYGTLKREKGAHSSYVQLGTEGGVVGLASLVLVLLGTMWAGWRGFRVCSDPFHRWLAMGVLGGIVAMAVCMTTGARFEPQKIFVFFWAFTAIVQRETVFALARRRPAA